MHEKKWIPLPLIRRWTVFEQAHKREGILFSLIYICTVLSKTQWMLALFFTIIIPFIKALMLQKTYMNGGE